MVFGQPIEKCKLFSNNISISGSKKRKPVERDTGYMQVDTFTVPCSLDVTLERAGIQEVDLYSQYKYNDLKWLIDFATSAAVVYIVIEIIAIWRPQIYTNEFNIGFVWCSMVVYFAVKELTMLTAAYWRSDDSGERSMTISFGFFFLIVAMGILVISEDVTDFGLEPGYEHFSLILEKLYRKMNFRIKAAPSIWSMKVGLAFFSAFLGAVLGFPGIRYANMHLDSLFFADRNIFIKTVLHFTFFSPVPLALLWVLPLSKELLIIKGDNKYGYKKIFSDESFLYFRIHMFILICMIRFLITKTLLQSHLNSANQKMAKLKKETGRISNLEIQRTVARVFYYFSAAALQYIAPLILMLFLGLMVRTLTYNMNDNTPVSNLFFASNSTENQERKEYAQLLRSLFSVQLFAGICSYLSWWSMVSYLLTSCFGMVYLKFLA